MQTLQAMAVSQVALAASFYMIAYIPNKILSFVTSIVTYFTSFCCQKSDLEMIRAFIHQHPPEEPADVFLQAFNTLPQQAKEFTRAIMTIGKIWSCEPSAAGDSINPSSAEALLWIDEQFIDDTFRKDIVLALQSYIIMLELPALSISTNQQDPSIVH